MFFLAGIFLAKYREMADVETVQVEAENGAKIGDAGKEKSSQADLTKLEQDIIRQIEYYFSEPNLRRDKFLIQKVAESEEGWVEISVLLTFNRLKSITEDSKAIADAMDKSPNGTVQVSEDRLKLRRHPENPLPEFNETRRKELQTRTAYAKGFPLGSALSTILDYFHSNFANVEQVQMRKYFDTKTKTHLFKGSVFVIFATREAAEEFVSKAGVQYNEKDLLRYTQSKYFEAKKKEREEYEKTKKIKKQRKEGEEEKEKEKEEHTLPKNAVVHFVKEKDEGELSREDIKEKIAEIDASIDIAFVHFQKGEKDGDIRFSKENDATKLFEKLEGGKVRNWIEAPNFQNLNLFL